ncbi:MAG: ABC transporter substrate-binding protein [Alphaproteobacteria bacterium]
MLCLSTLTRGSLSFPRYLVVTLIAYAVLLSTNPSQAASPPTRVAIAYPNPTPRVAPLWIAQELDFFGKYGLRAQVVLVRNNQMLSAGLAAGDIEFGYTGGTTVLGAAAAGVELKMVLGFVSRGPCFLVTRPDIKKPGDLAGKRFGVQSIGGTVWMYAMLTLEHLRLDPTRDRIQFMIIGDQAMLVRALESHVVDGMVLTSRAYSVALRQKGFNVLAEVAPPMSSTGIVTRKGFLEKNPETLTNVMRALIEAEYYVLAPRGKPQVIRTIMNRLKLSDLSFAEEGYADVIKDLDPKPYPSLEGVRNMQRLMATLNPKLADVNAASLVDSTFIRKLEESGFIAQLQASYRE